MRLRHIAAAAVPLVIAAGLTTGANATERHEPAAERQAAGPITPRFAQAIDTGSKDEVRAAYGQLWRSADDARPKWIGGSVKKCQPGTLSGSSTNKQLGAINFARLLAGLTPFALDSGTVAQAQAAALMMSAKDAVNHYPPKSWPCWSQEGYDAAGVSNLYQGERGETNADKIESYLDDWGTSNVTVGHRRWFLHPNLTAIGIGGTATANVSYLLGQPFNDAAPNPAWVSWPAAGWFPSRLDPRGRWSLSSGDDDADFSSAKVRVVFNKTRVKGIELHPIATEPGKPTLVWEMPDTWPENPVGTAKVTVSNITLDGSPAQSADYTVKFFRSR